MLDTPPVPTPPADLDAVLGVVQRLTVPMETLAAVGAQLRVEAESLEVDPAVGALLASITREAGLNGASPAARQAALGYVRSFFRLAVDLLEDPARAPGWSYDDPLVLQSIGRGSAAIAAVIAGVAGSLDGLEAALAAEGAAILDVGAGTGWLAIALAETFPAARVVGLDIWEPSLALARENVARAGLADRVEMRDQDVTALGDAGAYDLAWIACPFLPVTVMGPAIERSLAALRPGGWMVLGLFAGPDDPLASMLADLRTVRSGGHAWTAAELVATAAGAGLAGVRELPKTWNAPAGLVVGRRSL